MSFRDPEKLLGGYAAGNLTEAEKKALFEAALNNQALFDALADEEALRELLEDPRCRRQLLEMLGAKRPSFGERLLAWFLRPLPLALAGSAAVTVLIATTVLHLYGPRVQAPKPAVETAQLRKPEAERKAAPPAPAERPSAVAQKRAAPAPSPPPPREHAAQMAKAKTESVESAAPPLAPAPGGVVGGVPGGVIGGIIGALPGSAPAPPPSPAQRQRAAAYADRVAPAAEAENKSVAGAAAPKDKAADARSLFYGLPGRPLQASSVRRADQSQRLAAPRAYTGRMAPGGAVAGLTPASTPARLGLRYSVLKGTPGGQYAEVDPSAVLASGDAVRLSVEANASGYVYIFRRNAGGVWDLVYPPPGSAPGLNRVEERARYFIPSEGGFTAPVKLLLVFSREPQADIRALPSWPQSGRPLHVEAVRGPVERAVYIVDPAPASHLWAEINLGYR